jgi:alkylation response protein AidB-like acyl-CoA dehydrogenase
MPLDPEGLTVPPIREMTGSHHINGVRLDAVVPVHDALVGETVDRCRVIRSLLRNERITLGALAYLPPRAVVRTIAGAAGSTHLRCPA